MSTGYTEPVRKGKITSLREFVISCLSAFGRDMTPEEVMKPLVIDEDSYYAKGLRDAKEELVAVNCITAKEATKEANKEYESEYHSYTKSIREGEKEQQRYKDMLAQVVSWKLPSEKHENMKRFMTEQLTDSMRFDDYTPPEPTKRTGKEWLADKKRILKHDISYYKEGLARDIEKAKGHNAWVKKLIESLPND